MIANQCFTTPMVVNYKACFRFYRDTLGFSVVNGNEESNSGMLKQGSAKIMLFQQTAHYSRTASSITSAIIFSNIRKRT